MAEFTKFDYRMFEKAKEIAETSDFYPFKLGCVITYKHHIIGQGSNSNKTCPTQKYYNKRYRHFTRNGSPCVHSTHSEIAALMNIPYPVASQIDWKQVHVYIYRISKGKKSKFGLAAPCSACRNALIDKGVRHFYYTGDNSFIYERIN